MSDSVLNQLLILLLFSLFLEINTVLRIPLTYYPIHKYNDSTPSTIIDNIIAQKLYANIDIGSPRTTINVQLLFDTNEFFIVDNPKNTYDKRDFNDLKFYKPNESYTCIEIEQMILVVVAIIFTFVFINKILFILIIKI